MRIKKQELWDLTSYLIEYILPRLKAFKKVNINSYPGNFKSLKQWYKTLDKIIFAFEYAYIHDNKSLKSLQQFLIKQGFKNPHRKTNNNLKYWKEYQLDDGMVQIKFEKTKKPTQKNMIECRKQYHNIRDQRVIDKKVQEGFELFGKYFLHLWD